jgi:hypothetical protein
VAEDWSRRWAEGAPAAATVTSSGRTRLVTHLVLVDGLPADHWVEDGSDGGWESRLSRRGPARRSAPSPPHDQRERELLWLEALVGGRAALLALDDRPLVPRPLDVAGLSLAHQHRARAISAECDRLAVKVFACDELVAAGRHLFESVLTADSGMLGRSTRDDTATGALVWAVGHANGLIGPAGSLLARELWPRLGVSPSAAGRGTAMLARLAPGTDQLVAPPGAPRLRATGVPGALLGATRALLVARRQDALAT